MTNLSTWMREMEQRIGKATPEPWKWERPWKPDSSMSVYDGSMGCLEPDVLWFGMDGEEGIYCPNKNDSELIAHSRTDLRKALEIIHEMWEALEFYTKWHGPGNWIDGWKTDGGKRARSAIAKADEIAGG